MTTCPRSYPLGRKEGVASNCLPVGSYQTLFQKLWNPEQELGEPNTSVGMVWVEFKSLDVERSAPFCWCLRRSRRPVKRLRHSLLFVEGVTRASAVLNLGSLWTGMIGTRTKSQGNGIIAATTDTTSCQ